MQIKGQAKKVTIYIGESDKWEHRPLYMAILELLKSYDCAGATVTRALAGFGANSRIHTANVVALSADLPIIIEWVDSPNRVEQVMPTLQKMVTEGLMTVQDVEVVAYSHRRLRQIPATVPVQDIMSQDVKTVQANTPLLEVIKLLVDQIYRAIPVIDEEQQVVGIVTEGDLLSKVKLLAASAQKQLTEAEMTSQLQRLRRIDQTVAYVMTKDPITVTGQTTVAQAVKLMAENNIKRLPVVDDADTLIGIVSRVDVLRALSHTPVTETPRKEPPAGEHVEVGQVMMTNVPTVQTNTSLAEIVDLLVGNIQRRVVVVDDQQHVMGIITDGDLIKRATPTERSGIIQSLSRRLPLSQDDSFTLSQRTAAQVMTTNVLTVTPKTSLLDALRLLLINHIKRLPVVNGQGKLVGLVGRGGILQAINHAQLQNRPK